MDNSNFSFIKNDILSKNLDKTFNHIIELLSIVEDDKYREPAKSSFRKTIIIHTSSIIEALLFYIMDEQFSDDDISEFYSEWNFKNKKIIYEVNHIHQIVSGDYRKEKSKTKKIKMNLGQIAKFLYDKDFLNEKLFSEIDKIRKLRNEQHLGTHSNIKTYNKKDLEQSFFVASKVKELASKYK